MSVGRSFLSCLLLCPRFSGLLHPSLTVTQAGLSTCTPAIHSPCMLLIYLCLKI